MMGLLDLLGGWHLPGLLWDVLPALLFGPLGLILYALRRWSPLPSRALIWVAGVGFLLIAAYTFDRQHQQLASLREDRAKLEEAIRNQSHTIDVLQATIVSWRAKVTALTAQLSDQERIAAASRAEMERLRGEIKRTDLGRLAVEDPEAAAARAHDLFTGAADRLRCATAPDDPHCAGND